MIWQNGSVKLTISHSSLDEITNGLWHWIQCKKCFRVMYIICANCEIKNTMDWQSPQSGSTATLRFVWFGCSSLISWLNYTWFVAFDCMWKTLWNDVKYDWYLSDKKMPWFGSREVLKPLYPTHFFMKSQMVCGIAFSIKYASESCIICLLTLR